METNAGSLALFSGLSYPGNQSVKVVRHLQQPTLIVAFLQCLEANLHTVTIKQAINESGKQASKSASRIG